MKFNKACVQKFPQFKQGAFGKRAFAVRGFMSWNRSPKEMRLCDDEIQAFKSILFPSNSWMNLHLRCNVKNHCKTVKRPRMVSLNINFVSTLIPEYRGQGTKAKAGLSGTWPEARYTSQISRGLGTIWRHSAQILIHFIAYILQLSPPRWVMREP